MTNIANLQKLNYCQKKIGSRCTCSKIATMQVVLKSKKYKDLLNATQEWQYRCDEHANTPTVNKVVVKSRPIDQSYSLFKINEFLNTLIGKKAISKFHHFNALIVKYVKPNTGGVMCFNERNNQWKFIYYHQIDKIENL